MISSSRTGDGIWTVSIHGFQLAAEFDGKGDAARVSFFALRSRVRGYDVCPNCGGGFEPRPIRPRRNWRGDNDVAHHPASTTVRHAPVDADRHREFAARVAAIAPRDR